MRQLLFILLACLISVPARGEDNHHPFAFDKHFENFPQSKQHIQKFINHCWAISLENRSQPSLQIIDEGHFKTETCLENYYFSIYEKITFNETGKVPVLEVRKKFAELRDSYTKIYYSMNFIGSIMPSNYTTNIANTQYSFLVQDMLADLIYNAYAYKDVFAIQYIENLTP